MKIIAYAILLLIMISCSGEKQESKKYTLEDPARVDKEMKVYPLNNTYPHADEILYILTGLKDWFYSPLFRDEYFSDPSKTVMSAEHKLSEIIKTSGLESDKQYEGAYRYYYKNDPYFRNLADSIKTLINDRIRKTEEDYKKKNKR